MVKVNSTLDRDLYRDICTIPNCINSAEKFYRNLFLCPMHAQQIQNGTFDPAPLLEGRDRVYIYALEADGANLLKFGRSTNPLKRYFQIKDGSPIDIKLLGYCYDPHGGSTETEIHKYLDKFNVKGEWFTATPESLRVAEFIKNEEIEELLKTCKSRK